MTARAGIFGLAALVVAGGIALAIFRCEGTPPSVEVPAEVVLGRETREVAIRVEDQGSGVRRIDVTLVHAGGEAPLPGFREPRFDTPFSFSQPPRHTFSVQIDPKALGLREGTARLRVAARDGSWRSRLRGNEAVQEVPVVVDLTPPRVALESGLTYVRQGGAGALVYGLSEAVERDGVAVGNSFFPGYALGLGSAGLRRVALFVLPADAPDSLAVEAVAIDRAGNRGAARAAVRVQARPPNPEVPIRLSTRFLQEKVVPLADREGLEASDPVAAFQAVNTELRARNEARVRELIAESAPRPLFRGAFEQLHNSKVTSLFAERRAYLVEGRRVSEAVHYGFDLASTAHVPITASHGGRVVFADWLGIYGNCVLIDHGLGIASLYGHLSSIEVSAGQDVEQGQVLGRSGETGLAGGDHLHFAILVGGVYADPIEWWDEKWVRERIAPRLDASSP